MKILTNVKNLAVEKERETWVDSVKIVACILVVLGHFFQSLVKAEILPNNDLYGWFNQTIYFFHVQLFFLCSGYLYQRYSSVDTISSWGKNILKKLLALGIPYVVFTFATWILKTLFASSTNDGIGGLFETLFIRPTAPYWYLYTLFFIFLVTPTFKTKNGASLGFAIALALKIFDICCGGITIYALASVITYEIWFVIGMCICVCDFKIKNQKIVKHIGICGLFGFVMLSVIVYLANSSSKGMGFLLGAFACGTIIMLAKGMQNTHTKNKWLSLMANYTMPIYLMHTLFAAPWRTLLLKVGIDNSIVHIVTGIVISVAGPIIAAKIMEKSRVLEILLYPGKFIKIT